MSMYMCEINWSAVGTWVGAAGTFITGIALGFFAYKQNKISDRQNKINEGQHNEVIINQYMLHCYEVINILESPNFINKVKDVSTVVSIWQDTDKGNLNNIKESLNKLIFSTGKAMLFESHSIQEINQKVRIASHNFWLDVDSYCQRNLNRSSFCNHDQPCEDDVAETMRRHILRRCETLLTAQGKILQTYTNEISRLRENK